MVATIVNWDKDLALPLSKKIHIRHFVMALMLVICCQDIIIEIPLKKQSVIPILRKLKWKNLKAQLLVMERKRVLFKGKRLLWSWIRKRISC